MATRYSMHKELRPVGAGDHLELERLVIEAAWRVDEGQSDTLHELFTDDGVLILVRTELGWRFKARRFSQLFARPRS